MLCLGIRCDIRYITDLDSTVAGDDHCAGVAIFGNFKAQGLESIPTPPMTALTEFFHTDDKKCPTIIMVFEF